MEDRMEDRVEPPEQGATWVEGYERAGSHVSGYWRGKDGHKIIIGESNGGRPSTPVNVLSKKKAGHSNFASKEAKAQWTALQTAASKADHNGNPGNIRRIMNDLGNGGRVRSQTEITKAMEADLNGAHVEEASLIIDPSVSSVDESNYAPTLRLDSGSTRNLYLSVIGDQDGDVDEAYGAVLSNRLLPGDYRGYVYNDKTGNDDAVILHMSSDGELTSDVYEGVDKNDAWKIPVSDTSPIGLEFKDRVSKLKDSYMRSRRDVTDDHSKIVYGSVASDIDDIVKHNSFIDSTSASIAAHELLDKVDQYDDAGDDAEYDGDYEAAASFHEAADMIRDVLPEYMNR
jgi:hypothetical protein